ncbi:MAG: DUF89 family protein [Chloroflexi bacterium]|jgi:damage-control phosphatase, subfamily I|nr:DUF89 family protein [Chloroflexota bacterium]MBT7081085.1 DUF89 family protein [Chloroflexota bacterium]MBT7289478.1 DUF89 family protein [Chloroflexota bacterium]
MKAVKACYECLKRLACQAVDLAAVSEDAKRRAQAVAIAVLDNSFSLDEMTIVIASRIHHVIKTITSNPDPYREMKNREVELASQWHREIGSGHEDDYDTCLRLAALGNTIDFFKPYDVLVEELKRPVQFTIDHSRKFEEMLKQGGNLLYLADNAGEAFFDLHFVKLLSRWCNVTYVVKEKPVQNDITMDDLKRAGLESEFGRIITTGTATPGIDFKVASPEFTHEYETADLVFAKGMGYWESLSELPAVGRVFHCLMTKCQPVSDSLGVPLNSYVSMLR